MKKIIMYEAIDGERFETEEECETYEAPLLGARYYLSTIRAFDKNGCPIQIPNYTSLSFDADFENIIDKAVICVLPYDLPEETIDYLNEYIGLMLPDKKGPYRYSYDEWRWISYEEDTQAFLSNWGVNTFEELKEMGK